MLQASVVEEQRAPVYTVDAPTKSPHFETSIYRSSAGKELKGVCVRVAALGRDAFVCVVFFLFFRFLYFLLCVICPCP